MKVLHGTIGTGITPRGGVGIAIECGCGHISAIEMNASETQDLIALLQTNLSLAAKGHERAGILAVPLFVHNEGHG